MEHFLQDRQPFLPQLQLPIALYSLTNLSEGIFEDEVKATIPLPIKQMSVSFYYFGELVQWPPVHLGFMDPKSNPSAGSISDLRLLEISLRLFYKNFGRMDLKACLSKNILMNDKCKKEE